MHDAPTSEVPFVERIEAQIRAKNFELPVLPEVAVKVQEIVAADGPLSAVVAAIGREPAFAAALLRYANSVAFSGLRRITDLRDAVTRLGMHSVQQTILAIAAQNAFSSTDPHDEAMFRALWSHSIATAMAARRLAGRGVDAELAFLAGLLHDVGKVVILRCVAAMRRRGEASAVLSPHVLREFFDALHCRVGDLFFDSWNIPAEIREVVRRHHDPNLGPDDHLVTVVALADGVAARLGASLEPDPERPLLDTVAARTLRLDDVRLANLLVDVEDDLDRFEAR